MVGDEGNDSGRDLDEVRSPAGENARLRTEVSTLEQGVTRQSSGLHRPSFKSRIVGHSPDNGLAGSHP